MGTYRGVLCNRAQAHAYLHVHDLVQMRQASAQTLRWAPGMEPGYASLVMALTRNYVVVKYRFSGPDS